VRQNKSQVGARMNLRLTKNKKGHNKIIKKRTKLFHVFLDELSSDAIEVLPFLAKKNDTNKK